MRFFLNDGLLLPDSSNISDTIHAASSVDRQAAVKLLPMLDYELGALGRVMINRQPVGHTLPATWGLHEAIAKSVGTTDPGWLGRGHIFVPQHQK